MTIVEWINQVLVHKTPWENFESVVDKVMDKYDIPNKTNKAAE